MPTPPFRFVLVQTTEPGNIGSACRVLANFGFTADHLVLVAPQCDVHSPKAVSRAGQAHGWLGRLAIHADLPAAVADAVRVVGTTSVNEKLRQQAARPPRDRLPDLLAATAHGPVALLFGSEQSGLTHEQLLKCDELLTIPTAPDYPALNLAVSVGLVAYEAHLATLAPLPPADLPPDDRPANARLMEALFTQLFAAAESIEYFNPQNPLPLQAALRRILGKARLTDQEAQVLIGLARQILWKAQHGAFSPPGAAAAADPGPPPPR